MLCEGSGGMETGLLHIATWPNNAGDFPMLNALVGKEVLAHTRTVSTYPRNLNS